MYRKYILLQPENPEENNLYWEQVFDSCAEESISDEEARRLFEPIGDRILAGEFARPRHRFRPAAGLAALLAAIVKGE